MWTSFSLIILRPRAREGEWDVFFSHHPIDLGPGRESGASTSLIILIPRAREGKGQGGKVGRLFLSSSYRPRAREGEWGVYFPHHPKT